MSQVWSFKVWMNWSLFQFLILLSRGRSEYVGGIRVPSTATAWAVSSENKWGSFRTSETVVTKSLMRLILKASKELTWWTCMRCCKDHGRGPEEVRKRRQGASTSPILPGYQSGNVSLESGVHLNSIGSNLPLGGSLCHYAGAIWSEGHHAWCLFSEMMDLRVYCLHTKSGNLQSWQLQSPGLLTWATFLSQLELSKPPDVHLVGGSSTSLSMSTSTPCCRQTVWGTSHWGSITSCCGGAKTCALSPQEDPPPILHFSKWGITSAESQTKSVVMILAL